MKKRFLSLTLCLSFLLTIFSVAPLEAFAADENKCGDNLTWEIKTDGNTKTLIITGSGAMYDYDYSSATPDIEKPPWSDSREQIGFLELSNDITHIGDYAFYGFIKINKPPEFPSELETIGRYAFRECTNLYQIKFDDNLTEIGDGAFYNCSKLAKITNSKSLTTIGNLVFKECTALANITLYSGLKAIGQRTFEGCTKLVAITIPDTVTSIGAKAFNNCAALTAVDFGGAAATISDMAFSTCSELVTLSNMNAIESIGVQAFYGCTKLESVTIPESVSSIGAAAFAACLSLKEINVDPENAKYASIDGNLFNKDITVLYQYALGKKAGVYVIPDTVIGISALSFAYCNLKSLGISENVSAIGQQALYKRGGIPVYYEGTEKDWSEISMHDSNADITENLIYETPLYGAISDVTSDNGDVILTADYAFGKNSDCLAYVGIYDGNGVLVKAVKADKAQDEFVLTDTEISAGYTARLFFWNNETEFKPIGITTSLKL